MSLVIRQLPDAFTRMVPELDELVLPEETRANCQDCHMVESKGGCSTSNYLFKDETRCCTYHPTLPNFLVGRALARGGVGAEQLQARIREEEGVEAYGIGPSPAWWKRYHQRRLIDFGRRLDMKCPYYVDGQHTCSIWADRQAVCRTWFCRHADGRHGHKLWRRLKDVLQGIEYRLAKWAMIEVGHVPPVFDAPSWEAFYVACAEVVDEVDDDLVESLRDGRLNDAIAALEAAEAKLREPMPDVLVSNVRRVEQHNDRVWLTGYSAFDARDLPRTIFMLISALDGERTWQEALEAATPPNGPLDLDRDGVLDLYNAGILGEDPSEQDIKSGKWRVELTMSGYDEDGVLHEQRVNHHAELRLGPDLDFNPST